MWVARSLLVCLLVIASTNPAAAQHDTANAGALDGFAGAIATAGTVWKSKEHTNCSRKQFDWQPFGNHMATTIYTVAHHTRTYDWKQCPAHFQN